jgi:hypothetical protein
MKASKSSREVAPAARHDAGRAAEVVLDVEVDGDRVHMVLANCGNAVATDVRVEFSRTLAGIGDALAISDLPLFKRLGVLRPGRAMRVFWNAAPVLVGPKADLSPFVATVTWSERLRPRQRAEYRHDLSIYREWPHVVDT